jgi:hypothetical protein
MKTNFLFSLSAAFFVATLTTTFAQSSWETVDNLAKSRGRDIVADSQGNFISLAIDDSTTNTGPVSTAVSVSADHGATWQTVGSIAGYAVDLAVAPDGALFATGNRSDTVSGRAFLWQSLDNGATWTVIDPSAGLSSPMLVLDVAAGNSGAVYLCGYISGAGRWTVRKGQRTQSGITWTTIDTPGLGQATSVFVRPGMAGQPDEVLVCGGGWTVRRSLDSGATWNTLDSSSGSAFALTTAPDGGIYVVGRIATTTYVTNQTVIKKKVVTTVTSTTQYGWQVRKSANDGATWANVDYVANGVPQYSITADAFGRVFAVGFNDVTPRTWLVRGSSDGGATWMTTDPFLPSGATSTQAQAVASDAFGNVCVVGELYYGTTVSAPIRRLAAP